MDQVAVVNAVAEEIAAWIRRRRDALDNLRRESMAVNPFLTPLAMELNGYDDVAQLAAFFAAGHVLDGHQTGFGIKFDHDIIPLFGTTKLSRSFRASSPTHATPMWSVIDHIVKRPDGEIDLLALKASRWSIQLGQAKEMNSGFAALLQARDLGELDFDRIVIGVLYGKEEELTDKFSVAKGVARTARAANHGGIDISDNVDTYVGKDFWAWLNEGEEATQEWVLEGVLEGMARARGELGSAAEAFGAYQKSFEDHILRHERSDGTIDWLALLRELNG